VIVFPAPAADESVAITYSVDCRAFSLSTTLTRAYRGFSQLRELGNDPVVTITEFDHGAVPVKDLLNGF